MGLRRMENPVLRAVIIWGPGNGGFGVHGWAHNAHRQSVEIYLGVEPMESYVSDANIFVSHLLIVSAFL